MNHFLNIMGIRIILWIASKNCFFFQKFYGSFLMGLGFLLFFDESYLIYFVFFFLFSMHRYSIFYGSFSIFQRYFPIFYGSFLPFHGAVYECLEFFICKFLRKEGTIHFFSWTALRFSDLLLYNRAMVDDSSGTLVKTQNFKSFCFVDQQQF